MSGYRKWMVCVFFGILAFVGFILTDHSVTAFTALGGTLVGLAGWYHQANVQVHKNGNGKKPEGENHA